MRPVAVFDRRAWLALCAVLLVAAFMRLGSPGVVEFLHDEATLSLLALDLARGGPLPLTGMQSSVGIPNPPVSVYVVALPYLFTDDPLAATLFVAALNVAGVGLLWLLVYRYLGFWPALAAGMIYAVNPWAVLYSRKIWAQDFHTPFVLLALLLGLYGFGERRAWAQVLCLPLLLLAAQIHFAAWALVPLYALLVLLLRRGIIWRALAVSLALAALTLLPFAAGLAQTLAAYPQRITSAFAGTVFAPTSEPLRITAQFATGTGLENVMAPGQTDDFLRATAPLSPLWIGLLGGGLLVGTASLWRVHWRMGLLVTAWAALPLLVFAPGWTPIFPHYFIGSIPALCMLTAAVVTLLPHRLFAWTVAAALGAALLTQASFWQAALRYVDSTYTPGGFGTPLHFLRDVRDTLPIRDHVLVIADGFDPRYDQQAVIWSVLLHDTAQCARTLAGSTFTLYPANWSAVLVAPDAPPPSAAELALRDDAHVVSLRPGEGVYTSAALPPPDRAALLLEPVVGVRFDSGIQLSGYSVQSEHTLLAWTLPGPVAADYQFFVHYLDASGEKLHQADQQFWPGRHWCAGDMLTAYVDPPPAGAAVLRVGLYTLTPDGGFANAAVVDSAGNPVAQWADISLTPR